MYEHEHFPQAVSPASVTAITITDHSSHTTAGDAARLNGISITSRRGRVSALTRYNDTSVLTDCCY